MENNRPEEILKLIDDTLTKLKVNLKDKIEPREISINAKIPFKVATLKQVYLHRTCDFATSSKLLLSENRLVPAILLVRSIMETNAVFFRINELTKNAIKQKNPDELDEELMIILCGSRDTNETEYKSKNILGYIDKIKKTYIDYRDIYDRLSEFAHPNHDGCLGAYSKLDEISHITYLGFDNEYNKYFYLSTLRFLSLNMDLFLTEYELSDKMLPDLIEICEMKLKNNSN